MNSKIFWGLVIVVLSLFKFIPEDIIKYIVNYQVVIVLVGIYFLVKKKKHGWIFVGVGSYLSLFIIPLILGLVIVGLGVKEILDKKQMTKFSGKPKDSSKDEEVIEAEEIKK